LRRRWLGFFSGLRQMNRWRQVLLGNRRCRQGRAHSGYLRRRTAAIVRDRAFSLVHATGTKINLFVRFHLIGAITDQLRDNHRSGISGQGTDAGVSLRIGADGVVEFSRSREQQAEIGRDHLIGGSIQSVVGFECSGTHAQHQVAAVLRRRDRKGGLGTHAYFATPSQAQYRGVRTCRYRGTG